VVCRSLCPRAPSVTGSAGGHAHRRAGGARESHSARPRTRLRRSHWPPVRSVASGTPWASTTTWRFEPDFARFVGFGPVAWPPFLPGCSGNPPPLGSNQTHPRRSDAATAGARAAPTRRPLASRATAAAGTATPAAHLLWHVGPRTSRAQDEENAGQRSPIGHTRATALRFRRVRREWWLQDLPEPVRHHLHHTTAPPAPQWNL